MKKFGVDEIALLLQFGHGGEAVETPASATARSVTPAGFNSATAVKPWRHVAANVGFKKTIELQFGHGGEAVETRTVNN